MIQEVLVVEGKMDVVAIDKAVDADCIITGGFALHKKTLDDIEKAYKKRRAHPQVPREALPRGEARVRAGGRRDGE